MYVTHLDRCPKCGRSNISKEWHRFLLYQTWFASVFWYQWINFCYRSYLLLNIQAPDPFIIILLFKKLKVATKLAMKKIAAVRILCGLCDIICMQFHWYDFPWKFIGNVTILPRKFKLLIVNEWSYFSTLKRDILRIEITIENTYVFYEHFILVQHFLLYRNIFTNVKYK